ncbi:hypothetical protein N7G274_008707 [Stereocaulon virgatum]|uniref:DUF1740-domain-containing protein n=1 Tax=Stereocaulon virgatum TaxID=373712 RepID=A0ABR4A1M2_9LECA
MSAEAARDGSRAIPKFASFRPKNVLNDRADSIEPAGNTTSPHSPLHERRKVDDHCRSRYGQRARTHGDEFASLEFSDVVHETREYSQGSFIVDRAGDTNNLAFGGIHQYAIPSYHRVGGGNVLGSPREHRIDKSVSNDKGLILSKDVRHLQGRIDRRSLWKGTGRKLLQELRIKPYQTPDNDDIADFVALSANRRTRRRRGDDGSSSDVSLSSGDDDKHYRSVVGKARSNEEPADQDLIYDVDQLSSDDWEQSRSSTFDEAVQSRRTELLKRVDSDPANCDAWLDLIDQQDHIVGMKPSKRIKITDAERRSNAEVKLSIYEKAMGKVSSPEGRETLLLGMMEEAIKVWSGERLLSQWGSILSDNPGSLKLWTRFLDFKQTAFTSFRYDDVQNVYLSCLSMLHQARQTIGKTITEMEKAHEIQVYMILRMTLFMRESGFSELATAAWQALLEYQFFRPTQLQGHEHEHGRPLYETRMSMFEEFWDSEVPRLGEEKSEGWASFCLKQGDPPQPSNESAIIMKDGQDIWGSWFASEHRQGLLARKPARTIDEVEENDPYRVILFSDIRPFLSDSPSGKNLDVLLDAFLVFCGLPPNETESRDNSSRIWTGNGFLRNEALSESNRLPQLWRVQAPRPRKSTLEVNSTQNESLGDNSHSKDAFGFPLPNCRLSSGVLFAATGTWFSPFDAWQGSGNQDSPEMTWIIRALKTLAFSGVGGDSFAEFFIALELRLSPDGVRKTSRTLLKKQPANLRLYNAYALVEYRLSNMSKGEDVIITSINMAKTLESPQEESMLLWRTWVWELMNAGNAQDALQRLMEFANDNIQTTLLKTHQPEDQGRKPALLLRTENALTATRDHMLSLHKYKHASLAIECLILLNYLKSSSLPLATSTFKSNLALLPPTSPTTETLHQSFAQLLYHHTTHTRLFKPSEIRSLLAESIAQYPTNTIFLSLYAWNEARFRIDDRVRSIINDVVLSNNNINSTSHTSRNEKRDNVTSHFFAIHTELHRSLTFGSNNQTIRSTFERAITSSTGAHCASLYKLYFLFEHSRGEIAKAKAVFWRGVRACPWVKDMYLLAFEYLREEMDDGDLRGVYELMEEKGIRIHVAFEDEG